VSRWTALVGLVVGIVLAAGSAVLWLSAGAPPTPAAAPPVAPAVRPDPGPAPAGSSPAVPAAASAAVPVRIRAVDAGVDAPVVATGVDARGGMEIPQDVRTVGWYRFGARPGGSAGSAVLSGHVDDRIQGLGAFHRLVDLEVGDTVEVTLADGSLVTYRVDGVKQVVKAALPTDRVFARDGPPRLTLVTCGGDFDTAVRSYRDNVVVTAVATIGS
jgi:LPXTG-site transpeptidase (sortase) family protein